MSQYEYCFVSTEGIEGTPNECNSIYYSDRAVDVSKYTLAEVINELSIKKWEMVCCGNIGDGRHNIYFKKLNP